MKVKSVLDSSVLSCNNSEWTCCIVGRVVLFDFILFYKEQSTSHFPENGAVMGTEWGSLQAKNTQRNAFLCGSSYFFVFEGLTLIQE